MKNMLKPFSRELLWLLPIVVLTLLVGYLLSGSFSLCGGTIDTHLHDTYFVFPAWLIRLPLFLFLVVLVFTVRIFRNTVNLLLTSWITTIAGVALVVLLTHYTNQLSQIGNMFAPRGWTAYPPLSTLPQEVKLVESSTERGLVHFLTLLQALVLITLLFVAYRWGKRKAI